jgi:hypothetical protein
MPEGNPCDHRDALHPKVARVLAYWQSIHPPADPTRANPPPRLPGRRHFDPMAIPEALPGICLLDVERNPFRLRYRVAGTRIAASLGKEPAGRSFEEMHPAAAHDPTYLDRHRRVVETAIPSWRRGPPRQWSRRECIEIENLILPLAADGTTVDLLLTLTVMYWSNGTSE